MPTTRVSISQLALWRKRLPGHGKSIDLRAVHLDEIATEVAPGAHAGLVIDQRMVRRDIVDYCCCGQRSALL